LVWLATTVITYFDAREEFDEVLDAHLAQATSLLVIQASHDLDELETEHAPLLHKYARRVAFQVWEHGKILRLHSANAPQLALSNVEQGFSDSTIDGHKWRVFSTWDEDEENLIHVAEHAEVRDELAQDIASNLLRPLWFALPLLALLLWMAVARGLKPLITLTNEVETREPNNLAPLNATTSPREVTPLIERLNKLFIRIETSIQNERRFTADAAHELRTPVAAIKAQAQVARAANNEEERNHALDNAILGCNRAAHLISQLLTLNRVDTLDNASTEPCSLNTIAAETIAQLAPAALGKGVNIELLADEETNIRGNLELLRVLIRNLLDNAIKHNPLGTTVQLIISKDLGKIMMTVSDNGPGLSDEERAKVLQRFYRPSGTQAGGSGLGLSIVKRIVEVHHATLQILPRTEGQGLRVVVSFNTN
jgi:two-component system sensor histidine kinase QseC